MWLVYVSVSIMQEIQNLSNPADANPIWQEYRRNSGVAQPQIPE